MGGGRGDLQATHLGLMSVPWQGMSMARDKLARCKRPQFTILVTGAHVVGVCISRCMSMSMSAFMASALLSVSESPGKAEKPPLVKNLSTSTLTSCIGSMSTSSLDRLAGERLSSSSALFYSNMRKASSGQANMVDVDMSDALSLNNIRSTLIRLEDTIIFSLIERSQFARNASAYKAGEFPLPCESK
eukprot:gene14129-20088_t